MQIRLRGEGSVAVSHGASYSRRFEKSDEPFEVEEREWREVLAPTGLFEQADAGTRGRGDTATRGRGDAGTVSVESAESA